MYLFQLGLIHTCSKLTVLLKSYPLQIGSRARNCRCSEGDAAVCILYFYLLLTFLHHSQETWFFLLQFNYTFRSSAYLQDITGQWKKQQTDKLQSLQLCSLFLSECNWLCSYPDWALRYSGLQEAITKSNANTSTRCKKIYIDIYIYI